MIRHQTIGDDADAGVGMRFRQNLFEGDIVRSCLKQRQPSDATIQDMVGKFSGSHTYLFPHQVHHRTSCTKLFNL